MERLTRFYNVLYLLFLLALQIACSSSQLCSEDQYLPLLQFKNSFSKSRMASSACDESHGTVSYRKTSTWKRGTDCCSWNGSPDGGSDRPGPQLQQILPNNSLFSLHHLKKLNLAYNDVNMSWISSEFGMLTKLTHLNLSSSVFDGKIPSEISYLLGLVSLDVSYNYRLSIEPPSLISIVGNLTVSRELVLDSVNMSSVPPSSFTNLSSSLTLLGLGSCGLQGDFPGEVFQLPYLEKLRATTDSVCELKSLKTLPLSRCKFTGPIPLCFGNLTQITSLDFSINSFDREIPPSFSKLETLILLDISSNTFSVQIPESFSNFHQLIHLNLVSNNFTGQIPNIFGNLTQISYLDLSLNRLTGSIPSQVIGLSNLTSFSMSANKFDGTIPSWLFNHPSLVHLDLSSNMLTGSIGEFCSKSYDFISLGDNKLSGSIPSSIFERENLTELHLYSNNLSGSLDLDLFAKLKQWQLQALSFCTMTKFPKFLRAAENMIELHLSENNIQGPIPEWAMKMCKDSLQVLNLGHNSLTHIEKIPWRKLDLLNLQSNLLQGHLPVPPPSTTFFSVANNQLTGKIQIADL
ncbi:receptor-like protein Cf-9 [Tripterygium wilfordii]|uniref:receptor-like protein Cf-9 n=1 Tax=Tripterygium wilfordii TaxID=458696 RepID=UPI0018F85F5B|nr:receptor-like protein Cf-9 [Tripterygium wilfordii]